MRKYLLTVTVLLAVVFGTNAFAALSASISASPGTVIINQPMTANVAISNTSLSALTLTNLQITAAYNGNNVSRIPMALSVYNPSSVVLAANSITSVPMTAIFFAPSTGITGSGSGKYYIGALITASDGTVTSAATGTSVTVNPVPLPAYERQ
jgi:hypothetical protein